MPAVLELNEGPLRIDERSRRRLITHSIEVLTSAFSPTAPCGARLAPWPSALMTGGYGLFVTLKIEQRLRGCRGVISSVRSLPDLVRTITLLSAFHDDRFSPLKREELSQITITHSVIGRLQPVASWDTIELGIHGIVLSLGNRRAVFLPEVPLEQHWSLAMTLRALCIKGGVSPTRWNDPDVTYHSFRTVRYGGTNS